MPRFRCNTCRGEYQDVGPDGVRYFHACPLQAIPGAQPDPDLPAFTPPRFRERPDKRNENMFQDEPGKPGRGISEGRGRTRIPDVGGGP